jgi:hypothetical protein
MPDHAGVPLAHRSGGAGRRRQTGYQHAGGPKRTLRAAKSVGYSIGPSRELFSKVIIEKLGIVARVARGDVENGTH